MVIALELQGADVGLAAAGAIVAIGAAMAGASSNGVKSLIGVIAALWGATLGAAMLGAPGALLALGVAVGAAVTIVGGALVIRLQEAFGGVDIESFDQADRGDEVAGPGQ